MNKPEPRPMRTNYHTPPGWQRTVSRHGGLVVSHAASGIAVMKPWLPRHWFIFRKGQEKDPQPYRTWMDAVRDADESLKPRKESNHG